MTNIPRPLFSLCAVIGPFKRRYRSPYNLERLYPRAKQDPTALSIPTSPSKSTDKEFNGFIPLDKLHVQYDLTNSRSAQVRFPVNDCDWIPTTIRERFLQKFKHRIDKDGYFCVRSDRTRVASINLADCLDKLRFSINECSEIQGERKDDVQLEIEELRSKQEIETKKKLQIKKT